MVSKVAIVTGSNKGLGYEIVKGLCEKIEGIVYLTSRDTQRGKEACERLEKLGLKPGFHELDITNQKSVLTFLNHIQQKHDKIDIHVNNAAILFLPDASESHIHQAEQTIHVNFTSLVNFTELFIPLIRNCGRIVNISSSSGHLSRIPSKDIRERLMAPSLSLEELKNLVEEYLEAVRSGKDVEQGWGASPYVVSKVAVNAYTFLLDRRLRDKGILVNCIHPGYVKSDMTKGAGTVSPEDAAKWPLYLVTEAVGGGRYMWSNGTFVSWDGEDPRRFIDGKVV